MLGILVPPLRSEVEQVIGAVNRVQTARVSRIGVIARAVVATTKDADPRGLLAIGLDRAEIVLEALLARLERRAIVEVEVAAGRRYPAERPAHARLVGVDLRQRRARDGDQRRVAMRQMNVDAIVVVGPERAARAALGPVRSKHEMIDQQLA